MPDDRAREFSSRPGSVVVAAAGCGKTELIADAVQATEGGRQLVLTHTHAGVRALRYRLRKKRVDPAKYIVDTISGFALQYALSFPSLSGYLASEPSGDDWASVYEAAWRALQHRHVRSIVTHSYTGLFVDEYQDCTIKQHAIICLLAELIPTHIVGDPLQGIFDFGGDDKLVDWPRDVYPHFRRLADLETPYRWRNKNDALGKWLVDVRSRLLSGQPVQLDHGAPIRWIPLASDGKDRALAQVRACQRFGAGKDESVAIIRRLPNQAHSVAKKLGGRFRSMEEVECRDLLDHCERLDACTGIHRAEAVVDFALKCMTKKPVCLDELAKLLKGGRCPGPQKLKNFQELKNAVQAVADDGGAESIGGLLQVIRDMRDVTLHRRELYQEMERVMRNHSQSSDVKLRSIAWRIRDRSRRLGRLVDPRVVSRTTLIKGLEFDHAIIVDVDDFKDAKNPYIGARNLYVALTRGSKSLTVMSASSTIQRPTPGLEVEMPDHSQNDQLSLAL